MQPAHYIHKAEADTRAIIGVLHQKHYEEQALFMTNLLDLALMSPVYVLPDGGNLIGADPWRVFADMTRESPKLCRLPHPVLVVEYETSSDDYSGPIHCDKRATLCIEPPGGGLVINGSPIFYGTIDFWHHAGMDRWMPDFHTTYVGEARPGDIGPQLWYRPLKNFDDLGGRESADDAGRLNLYSGACAAMSLICALACRNVRQEEIDHHKLNKARISRGKKPFAQHYVLKLAPDIVEHGRAVGHHASPALHLRRGHIRRLHSGQRTWVNAHMVGTPKAGVAPQKDYDATPLASSR